MLKLTGLALTLPGACWGPGAPSLILPTPGSQEGQEALIWVKVEDAGTGPE